MATKWLFVAPVAVGVAAGIGADQLIGVPEAAKLDVKPALNLPITRVVI